MASSVTLGQGILQHHSSGDKIFIWAGKAFNPNDEGVLIYTGSDIATPEMIGEIYGYNLAGVNPGTEIVIALMILEGPLSGNLNYYWTGPGGNFFDTNVSISIPTGSFQWRWVGTGLRHEEIASNGSYSFVVNLPGGSTITKNFTVSGIAAGQMDRFTSGYLWVEGDTIAYIDGVDALGSLGTGYKHRIPNDGVNLGSGLTPGYIWIPTSDHGTIHFIDSSGIHRRTILGDYQGVTYDGGSLPQTPGISKAGFIYAQNQAGFHWTYLMFVGNDGKLYRISHTTNLQ